MNSVRSLLPTVASCILLALCTVPATGTVIVSTYDGSTISGTASPLGSSGKGVGFSMPVGTAYTLDSMQVYLSSNATDKPVTADVTLAIYSNDGGNTPGVLLHTLVTPTLNLTGSTVLYTFNPASTFTLLPATSYWVVMTNDRYSLDWKTSTGNTTYNSSIGATYLGAIFGSGSTPDAIVDWTSTSGVRNTLIVNATAVPEPGSMLLLLGSGMLLLGIRRRG